MVVLTLINVFSTPNIFPNKGNTMIEYYVQNSNFTKKCHCIEIKRKSANEFIYIIDKKIKIERSLESRAFLVITNNNQYIRLAYGRPNGNDYVFLKVNKNVSI